TEVYVDRVLYQYLWTPAGSVWRRPDEQIGPSDGAGRPWRPAKADSPHFAWHPASALPKASTADILIVVPARSRPHNIRRLLKAFGDTKAWGAADLRIDIDADDPAYREYLRIKLPDGARFAVGHKWQPAMKKLNRA